MISAREVDSKVNLESCECTVCLEEYQEKSQARAPKVLPDCGHMVCASCITGLKGICHICRHPFTTSYDAPIVMRDLIRVSKEAKIMHQDNERLKAELAMLYTEKAPPDAKGKLITHPDIVLSNHARTVEMFSKKIAAKRKELVILMMARRMTARIFLRKARGTATKLDDKKEREVSLKVKAILDAVQYRPSFSPNNKDNKSNDRKDFKANVLPKTNPGFLPQRKINLDKRKGIKEYYTAELKKLAEECKQLLSAQIGQDVLSPLFEKLMQDLESKAKQMNVRKAQYNEALSQWKVEMRNFLETEGNATCTTYLRLHKINIGVKECSAALSDLYQNEKKELAHVTNYVKQAHCTTPKLFGGALENKIIKSIQKKPRLSSKDQASHDEMFCKFLFEGRLDHARIALQHGANPHSVMAVPNDPVNPLPLLFMFVKQDKLPLVEFLLDLDDFDINKGIDKEILKVSCFGGAWGWATNFEIGTTALHFAAMWCSENSKVFAKLLEHQKVNLVAVTSSGQTPLHRAGFALNVFTITRLLGSGIFSETLDRSGRTPFDYMIYVNKNPTYAPALERCKQLFIAPSAPSLGKK